MVNYSNDSWHTGQTMITWHGDVKYRQLTTLNERWLICVYDSCFSVLPMFPSLHILINQFLSHCLSLSQLGTTYTVLGKRDRYFVLLNYTHKSCSNMKSMVIIGLCCSWGFRNTPWMLNFIKIWLRYWRSKTEDPIQNSVWDLISSDESLTKLWQILQKSDLYQFF